MTILSDVWRRLAEWFAQAVPAAPVPADAAGDAPDRQAIHDVTREQLGVAHWSCHTPY